MGNHLSCVGHEPRCRSPLKVINTAQLQEPVRRPAPGGARPGGRAHDTRARPPAAQFLFFFFFFFFSGGGGGIVARSSISA